MSKPKIEWIQYNLQDNKNARFNIRSDLNIKHQLLLSLSMKMVMAHLKHSKWTKDMVNSLKIKISVMVSGSKMYQQGIVNQVLNAILISKQDMCLLNLKEQIWE